MRLSFFAAALAGISVTGVLAAQTAEPDFSAERVRAHVEFLADDMLEGRNAGERGYDIAAKYVATRFQALGLKPAAAGSWYQQVPFLEYGLADAPATVTIGGRAFRNREDVILSGSEAETQQSVEAPVVFAGYGLDAPSAGFNDYEGLDVRGKIVAVLSGFPRGTPSEMGAHLSSEKRRMADRHGAVGMVTILTRADEDRRPWARRVQMAGSSNMTWIGTDGRPYSAAPGIRVGATLGRAAAEALFAGGKRPLEAVLAEADRQGGKPKGFALKPRLKVDRQSVNRRLTSPNVVAVLPGSDPALANEYVLLMAHLDHDGLDPKLEGDKIYNGAMDNAAGTATMLEVARAMATAPVRPRRSILFAAVTAEEDGLLGSEYLAKHPVVDGKIAGVVNLDMPILLYDFSDVIAFGSEHSTLGPIVARAAAGMNVALSPDPLPQEGLFTRSDHYKFVREGIPSVFLMTGFAGEGEKQFKDFLATHYHKPSDEPDLPFNWNAGAKFARLNYLIAREIANSDTAPLWYGDSFFGRMMAPAAPKAQRPTRTGQK
ncbi:MAG: M28 family metallopeptidase [Pseudomonadota bacterium]|nr:M28 family metallopeptidase [Pseudomonadota bacterium]